MNTHGLQWNEARKRILNGSNEFYIEQELNLGTLELDMKGDSVVYVFIEKEMPFF